MQCLDFNINLLFFNRSITKPAYTVHQSCLLKPNFNIDRDKHFTAWYTVKLLLLPFQSYQQENSKSQYNIMALLRDANLYLQFYTQQIILILVE